MVAGEGRYEKLLFNRQRISVLQDEKALEMGCTSIRIYFTATVHLEMVKMVILLCVFHHN